jgi:hypothetical protein
MDPKSSQKPTKSNKQMQLERIIASKKYAVMNMKSDDDTMMAKSMINNFEAICIDCVENGVTQDKVNELVETHYQFQLKFNFTMGVFKTLYNFYLGWGIPSSRKGMFFTRFNKKEDSHYHEKSVVDHVMETFHVHLQEHPDAKLIDLGGGSGLFSSLFSQYASSGKGGKIIDSRKIVCVDLTEPTHGTDEFNFYPITRCSRNVKVAPQDMIFISWGTDLYHIVDQFIKDGGKRYVVYGETKDGCTFPSDYVPEEYNDSFDSAIHGPYYSFVGMDFIGIHTRKN